MPDTKAGRQGQGAGRIGTWAQVLACVWLLLVVGLAIRMSVTIVDQLRALPQLQPQRAALRAASLRFAVATFGLAIASMVICGALAPVWRRRAVLAVALIPVPILLVTSHSILAGAAALALLCPALWLGRELGARLLGLTETLESWVIGSAIGLGVLAILGATLAQVGLLRAGVVWPLLSLVTLALLIVARRNLLLDLASLREWLCRPAACRTEYSVMAGIALGFFWLNLIGALAPELYADAVVSRLPVAALIARTGRFTSDPDLPVSAAPRFTEIVYALSLTVGPLQVTKLLDLAVGLLCAAGVGVVAKRLAGPCAALLAAVVFYTLPLTAQLSQTAYTDLFATFFAVTAAVLIVRRDRLGWRTGLAALVAIAAGMSVKVSFTATATGLALALVLLLPWRRRVVLVIAGVLASATLAYALVLAPLGRQEGGWLPRVGIVATIEGRLVQARDRAMPTIRELGTFGTDRSVASFVASPLNLIVHTARFGGGEYQDGFLGYLLLALLPLVVLTRPSRRLVALTIGTIVAYLVWFLTAQYLRYALPILALQCALGGVAYAAVGRRGSPAIRRTIAILTTGLIGLNVLAWLNTSLLQPGAIPYRVALGAESRSDYLTEHLTGYGITSLFDRQPDATRLLATHNYARLYSQAKLTTVDSVASFVEWGEEETLAYLDQGQFSHIMVDRSMLPKNWDRILAIGEGFLRRNAVLVGSDRNAYLYRLVPAAQRGRDQGWARGPELLPNGGLEQPDGANPQGWSPYGRPTYDRSGAHGRTGQAAIRSTTQDWYTTTVKVQPQVQYLLTHATRADGAAGLARLQVNWLNATDQIVGVALEVVPTSPLGYFQRSMLATAPPGATKAMVYLVAQQGVAWFDDVSFCAVAVPQAYVWDVVAPRTRGGSSPDRALAWWRRHDVSVATAARGT